MSSALLVIHRNLPISKARLAFRCSRVCRWLYLQYIKKDRACVDKIALQHKIKIHLAQFSSPSSHEGMPREEGMNRLV